MKKITFFIVTLFLLKVSMAQHGMPDYSFGINGVVKTDTGSPYNYSFSNSGYKIFQGNNGTIFIVIEAGGETFIARKKSNGATDSLYGNNGLSATAGITGHDAVMQPDGKIIVAGSADDGFNSDFALTRYNIDGSLDTSFSGDGKQTTSFGSFSFATSVALQQDGKIVVAGSANSDFAVARYNRDGSPDNSFSEDGKQTTDFNSVTEVASSVAIQKDSRIVVAGFIWNGTDNDFALTRYNTDGSPDSTFCNDGKQITSFGGNDNACAVAMQRDGKIVVGGFATPNQKYVLAFARYNINGRLDSTFSADGKQTTDYDADYSFSPSLVIQEDAKIIITHYIRNHGNYDFAVTRYNTDGSIDDSFSGDGKQTTDFNGGNDYARAIAIQNDGKILLTGSAEVKGAGPHFAICRYNKDGTVDNTFYRDGKLEDKLLQGYTVYKSTAIQKDGKIVAAGYTWNGSDFDFLISRYNTDGMPDTTFNGKGTQTTSFGAGDDLANAVAIRDNGQIVVAGSRSNGKDHDFAFAAYNTNGQPDKTFSEDGKQIIEPGPDEDYANAMVIQNDGKILAAGLHKSTSALVRLNVDGSLDNTFSGDGIQTTDFETGNSQYNAITLQKDGKIVLAGIAGFSYFTLARYTADGNLDKTFANNGMHKGSFGYGYSAANAVALQKDGKIIVAADVSQLESTTGFAVACFGQDGKPDSTFGQNGFVVPDDILSYSTSVAVRNNGKILVGGSYGNHSSLTQLNTNGTPDADFGDKGIQVTRVSGQQDIFNGIALVNSKPYAAGSAQCPGNVGTIAKYQLNEKDVPVMVTLTAPADNARYIAPANIKLIARAKDPDGRIIKVKFYNGPKLLRTKRKHPYTFLWRRIPVGDYSLTAKAADNKGQVAISEAVHISVLPNKAPYVSIILPSNGQTFAVPRTIHLTATAKDPDGRINKVRFYDGSRLLKTIHTYPYTYSWRHVPAGTYSITAVATDDHGLKTASVPVTITCVNTSAVTGGQSFAGNKMAINNNVSIRLAPNPANNILDIYTTGWKQNTQLTISVISASGTIMKTIRSTGLNQHVRLNISFLTSGTYTIKVLSNDKTGYRQFIKL